MKLILIIYLIGVLNIYYLIDLENIPNEIYNNIGGYKKIINEVISIIYYSINDKYKINNGLLICGNHGIGKTFIITKLCEYLSIPLIIINEYSNKNIIKKINQSIKYSPSLILIDDIDSIEDDISDKLIYYLDKLIWSKYHNIIICGLSQTIYSIKPDWLCGNRLCNQFVLHPPTEEDRSDIINIKLKQLNILYNENDIKDLSLHTNSYFPLDIDTLLNETISHVYPKDVTVNDIKEYINIYIPSNSDKEFYSPIPNITFNDLGGINDIIKLLTISVILPLKDPNYYKRLGINPVSGLLLYGPSGCGKTTIINSLAKELNNICQFISINCTQIISKIVSESEHIISKLFTNARKISPCIIFFDNIDSIAPIRGNDTTTERSLDRMLSTLLTEIDGITSNKSDFEKRIIIIGATTDMNKLDPAILRPGRLDQHIFINYPNKEEKIDILKKHLNKIPMDNELKENINELIINYADKALFHSTAKLINTCKEATLREIRKESNILTKESLELAFLQSLKSF